MYAVHIVVLGNVQEHVSHVLLDLGVARARVGALALAARRQRNLILLVPHEPIPTFVHDVVRRLRQISRSPRVMRVQPCVDLNAGFPAFVYVHLERVEIHRLVVEALRPRFVARLVVGVAAPAHLGNQDVEVVLLRVCDRGLDSLRAGDVPANDPYRSGLRRPHSCFSSLGLYLQSGKRQRCGKQSKYDSDPHHTPPSRPPGIVIPGRTPVNPNEGACTLCR